MCVVSYELAPAAVGPGCPACDFGWEFTLVDAQPAGPDCARVGVFSAQSSRRGPLHYGYRETSGGAVRLGELLLAPGSAPWAIAGTVQIGGDPAVSADYLVTGTWPEPFSAP
ncbi:MAG: hypothetical protein IT376_02605 [Polyangiaceae bacterium]|nr:hypothetical protein [Polyangiaceae bacterium]